MPDEQPDEPVSGVPLPAAPPEPATTPPVTDETVAVTAAATDEADLAPVTDEADRAVADEADRAAVADEADLAAVTDEAGTPDERTLARISTPGLVRRAPRYGAFVGYGAVLGFVVGVVLAIALDRGDLVAAGEGGGVLPFLAGSNGARLVTGVALAGVGAIVGALLALWADARSRRRAR